MKTIALFPGVTLHAEKECRFKSEYLSVNFICTGDLYSRGDRAHAALLSPVLSTGSAKYKTEAALDEALLDLYDASLYAHGTKIGEAFVLPFSLSVHNEKFLPSGENLRKNARDLLFSFMLDPLVRNGAFLKDRLARQKKSLREMIRREKTDKPRYAAASCMRLLCEGEPFAYSSAELKRDLSGVTPQSLYAFYEKILSRAPIEVFYAGEEDENELADDLRARLSPLFTPKDAPVKDVVSPLKDSVRRKTERMHAHQSTLCVGYKTPILANSPDYPAFLLLREMLCRSPLSLIFTELREKMSLCYYCYDAYLARKGVFMLSSGIDGKAAERTEKEIDRQIGRLIGLAYDKKLLDQCKRSIVNALSQMKDSPSETEGWLVRKILAQNEQTPEEEARAILAVTAEDVSRAAASLKKDSVFLLEGKRTGGGDHV